MAARKYVLQIRMKRNELVQAKRLAAQRGVSLSSLVRWLLASERQRGAAL